MKYIVEEVKSTTFTCILKKILHCDIHTFVVVLHCGMSMPLGYVATTYLAFKLISYVIQLFKVFFPLFKRATVLQEVIIINPEDFQNYINYLAFCGF